MQVAGELEPAQLEPEHVQAAINLWRNRYAQHTRSTYAKCLRRFLRYLERSAGVAALVPLAVTRIPPPEPRTTIATPSERQKILAAAPPHMRLFLMLCAETGLRHKTASKLTPRNYSSQQKTLTFTTKGNVQQCLPVSKELSALIESLDLGEADRPLVALAHDNPHRAALIGRAMRFTKQWKRLKRELNIRPELRIHDLRRTVAEDTWEATRDLRAVQAQLGHRSITTTARYLANRLNADDLRRVLELTEAYRRSQKEQKC